MATPLLEILPAAVEEALEAARWYRERSPKAAFALQVEIRVALTAYKTTPKLGRDIIMGHADCCSAGFRTKWCIAYSRTWS